ncbi:phosphotransferase [Paenirhodobacter populi]|nr:phosphotransferase [Sinirhodobacter populi]
MDRSPGAGIDLGALSTPFTPMDAAQAARVARDVYGLDGTPNRMETEKDDTFRLTLPDGRRFVLKIANPGESHEELDLQVSVLRHLERHAPDLPVPRVFADLRGRAISGITDADGTRRSVRLMSFLTGTVLDTIRPDAGERHEIGRLLARLRLALADFTHPGAGRVLAWDVRQLPLLAPLLADVEDAGQRRALETGFARFMDLRPRIDGLRRQVLHNDFSRSNILVDRGMLDRGGPARVSGIIDFGDVVETAIAIDVSTALLNQLPRDAAGREVPDLLAEARQLLAGYLEIAALTDDELSLIPHLVMGRIVARALLSLWRARMFPDNSRYILRNTGQGWAQLDWFLARGADEVSALLL